MESDPYAILGVKPGAPDAEVRSAYHRLVQLHHPDHNQGSDDAARRFEQVQLAYARVKELRAGAQAAAPPPIDADPAIDARLADMERELREAHEARERARRAAAEAAAARTPKRASDEELGYVKTDDSFSKILADARSELAERFDDAREHPAGRRLGSLIDELAGKLTGEDKRR